LFNSITLSAGGGSEPNRNSRKPLGRRDRHRGPRPRDSARAAAKLAASEQDTVGETAQISHEDEKKRWRNEVDSGTDNHS
jgi:hypothetical protein